MVEQSAVVAPGTKVFFATSAGMAAGNGSLAEWCVVPDADLIVLDTAVPDTEVAALGLSGVAGWMALTWRAQLTPGERVLVLGGGGAVGQVAIGAARVLGAERVVAVVRSDASGERALAAGADEVVALSTDVDELTSRLGEAPFEVVIDSVFGVAATAAARVLASHGRLVNLGGSSGDEATFSSAALRSRTASILGYTNNAITPDQRRDALTAVLEHAATGAIKVAHETLALADIATAWHRQSTGATAGRLVVTI